MNIFANEEEIGLVYCSQKQFNLSDKMYEVMLTRKYFTILFSSKLNQSYKKKLKSFKSTRFGKVFHHLTLKMNKNVLFN